MGNTKEPVKISLARFVSERREKLGLSQNGLAKKCMLELSEIENIEGGFELFLSTTIRQKLAKGLRVTLAEIKSLEINQEYGLVSQGIIDEIKERILALEKEINCPNCGTTLQTRIAKMYDLEDNLILHPKAHCPKCPFQIK